MGVVINIDNCLKLAFIYYITRSSEGQIFPNQRPQGWKPVIHYDPQVQTRDNWGGYQVRGKPVLWSWDGFARRYYINMFLGVQYALAPVGDLRFRNPKRPKGWVDESGRKSDNIYDATYHRPACPQHVGHLQSTLRGKINISEDCLYLNIFAPNVTFYPYLNRQYPVLVFFHGGEFQRGSAQEWPGYELAKKNIVVVTVNYRLGPFGFLSTEDKYSPGNYGLMDQQMALEYIRDNIAGFYGDPTRITIVGHEAGAASVGLHLVSRTSRSLDIYNRAIAMSGSDMCEWAVIPADNSPREYAYELGRMLGCQVLDHYRLVECLRKNRKMEDIIAAGGNVTRKSWAHSGPWAPVVDGEGGFLSEMPKVLREKGLIAKVKFMSGITKDEGAWLVKKLHADNVVDMTRGATPVQYDLVMDNFVDGQVARFFYERGLWYRQLTPGIHPDNVEYVKKAVKFEYTYWVNKKNDTARLEQIVFMYGDKVYGTGVDLALKSHVKYNMTYSYVFGYRSVLSPLPKWMGVPHGSMMPYVFGLPFMNTTMRAFFNLRFSDTYDLRDRNISEFVMDMWSNFTTSGNSTPYGLQCYHYPESWYRLLPEGALPWNLDRQTQQILQEKYPNYPWLWGGDPSQSGVFKSWRCNITWPQYNVMNLTYLNIENDTYERYNYRQDHYAFWRDFFPDLVLRIPITTTPWPTPQALIDFQTSTWTLGVCSFLLILLVMALSITMCRRRNKYG